jgi:hypothetical protein
MYDAQEFALGSTILETVKEFLGISGGNGCRVLKFFSPTNSHIIKYIKC